MVTSEMIRSLASCKRDVRIETTIRIDSRCEFLCLCCVAHRDASEAEETQAKVFLSKLHRKRREIFKGAFAMESCQCGIHLLHVRYLT